jgi:RND family efflux transporter MFP subunit
MAQEPLHRLIRSLGPLAAGPPSGLSDAQLLERFAAARDEAAFELLLWRHGPAVLGLCRRLLPQQQDAEDAFQATFLVLAKKAGSIARGQAVGAWLYRVAYRVALKARAGLARRAGRERPGVDELAAPPDGEVSRLELLSALDEEVERLPARHRAAFVLCCLEGKTNQEAARELGCPPGTVSSRLTRAREQLRRRLARRGLAPAGVLAGLLSGDALAAPLPRPLVGLTLKAALAFCAGGAAAGAAAARSVAYAEGVLRAMFLTRLKVAALALLLAGLLAAGGVVGTLALEAAAPPGEGQPEPKAPPGPAVVRVVKPTPGGLGRTTRQPGTVQAFDREDVFAPVPGVLKGLAVDIGSRVKKGQVLAQIDAPLLAFAQKEADAAVRQARGLVREAQAKVGASKAKLQAAKSAVLQREAEVSSARANLTFREGQLKRVTGIAQRGATPQSVVEEARAKVESARAPVTGATAALTTAKAEVEVKHGELMQAEAALSTAMANADSAEVALEKAHYSLGLTKLVAPFDGVVTQRNYRDGAHVGPAGEGPGRLSLLTVVRTDRMLVVVDVPSINVPLTEPGVPVDLAIDALPAAQLSGCKVSRVGFALDPKTRTMRVEIDVPNPGGQLRPGMFGTATLHLRKPAPGAVRLPASCLVAAPGGKKAVYVVRGGKARRTEVRVGHRVDEEVEVLSGLKPADLVVTDPRGLTGEVVPVEVKEGPGAK